MKPPGSVVTLHWVTWEGPLPRRGNYLRTMRGRLYRIYRVRGHALVCVIQRPDAEIPPSRIVYEWFWNARRRRKNFRPLL